MQEFHVFIAKVSSVLPKDALSGPVARDVAMLFCSERKKSSSA